MKWAWIILIAFSCSKSSTQQITKIDNAELILLLKDDNVQLVDVRTPSEVSNGIIEKAITIDFSNQEFKTKISQLDKEKPVAIYCAVGGRSGQASRQLAKLGFVNIYDLEGGFRGWKSEGHPIVDQ